MASLFTRIIAGELPSHRIWEDDTCVAFLTINPLTPGHTLVVPRDEIPEWTQAAPDLLAHLTQVAQTIGRAQQEEWQAHRIGLLAQGYEVDHLHLHVWATSSPADFDLRRAQQDPDQGELARAAESLRSRLRADGHTAQVPAAD